MEEAKYTTDAVEALVTKRLNNFDYMKRVYQGSVPWMNTVLLTKEDIYLYYQKEKKEQLLQKRFLILPPPPPLSLACSFLPLKQTCCRAGQWFYVGISLSPILAQPSGQSFANALLTFWDEYEHFCGRKVSFLLLPHSVLLHTALLLFSFVVGDGVFSTQKAKDSGTTSSKDLRQTARNTSSGANEYLNTPNIVRPIQSYLENLFLLLSLPLWVKCCCYFYLSAKFVIVDCRSQQVWTISRLYILCAI